MHAKGAAAACQAMDDYDADRGVPWGAFVRLRILSSLRTRHRQEWSYAVHCGPGPIPGEAEPCTDELRSTGRLDDALSPSLAQLAEPDRRLLRRLFWDGCTEAALARELGIAQSTVNKYKRSILQDLRRSIAGRGGQR